MLKMEDAKWEAMDGKALPILIRCHCGYISQIQRGRKLSQTNEMHYECDGRLDQNTCTNCYPPVDPESLLKLPKPPMILTSRYM